MNSKQNLVHVVFNSEARNGFIFRRLYPHRNSIDDAKRYNVNKCCAKMYSIWTWHNVHVIEWNGHFIRGADSSILAYYGLYNNTVLQHSMRGCPSAINIYRTKIDNKAEERVTKRSGSSMLKIKYLMRIYFWNWVS